MAKKQLTKEEKLQAALVPEEEQPYKVPENWCWVRLSSVAKVITGGTPSKKHPEYYGSDFPFFKPADLDSGRSIVEASEYLSAEGKSVARIIPAHSTAVCCIGTIGKCGYLEVDGATNQQINSMIPKINPLYLYYYANTELFISQLWSKAVATTISIVNKSKMESNNVPLPPLTEQSRIVARIESLFAKLDDAKEKIQKVLDGADLRRAAILHQAFTGKLTAKWRLEHDLSIDDWCDLKLGDVITRIKYGTSEKSDYNKSAFPVLRIPNITDDGLDLSDLKYLPKADDSCRVNKDDILVIRSNGSRNLVGKCVLVPELDNVYFYASFLIGISPSERVIAEFLVRFLNSEEARGQIFAKAKSSAGIHNVNSKELKAIEIKLPSISEQQEIVRLLDNLLSREQSTVTACDEALTTIDTLKKSILARAFRGELGTGDPADPSAKELLREILSA